MAKEDVDFFKEHEDIDSGRLSESQRLSETVSQNVIGTAGVLANGSLLQYQNMLWP